MKIILFIFVLFGFLFISQADVFAQKKSKKIETWEVDCTYHNWYYEQTNYGFNDRCIVSWQLTFQNNSAYSIRKIKVKLFIETNDGTILYKKEHIVNIDLDPGETVASDVFNLKKKVCAGFSFEPTNFKKRAEIISVN